MRSSPIPARAALLRLALVAIGLALPGAVAADPASLAGHVPVQSSDQARPGTFDGKNTGQAEWHGDVFHGEPASADVRDILNWVTASGDNRALPFVIVDKVNAKVFLFGREGEMRGAAPALLGLAHGDDSVPGIGQRKLATIRPSERTTPAGRFVAALGRDFEQDILWIDYDAAISLHRVIVGNPKDHRAQRLASASTLDNRISFGCINVPAAFYDDLVAPAFKATVGIVYILPDTKPLRAVFPLPFQQALKAPGGNPKSP